MAASTKPKHHSLLKVFEDLHEKVFSDIYKDNMPHVKSDKEKQVTRHVFHLFEEYVSFMLLVKDNSLVAISDSPKQWKAVLDCMEVLTEKVHESLRLNFDEFQQKLARCDKVRSIRKRSISESQSASSGNHFENIDKSSLGGGVMNTEMILRGPTKVPITSPVTHNRHSGSDGVQNRYGFEDWKRTLSPPKTVIQTGKTSVVNHRVSQSQDILTASESEIPKAVTDFIVNFIAEKIGNTMPSHIPVQPSVKPSTRSKTPITDDDRIKQREAGRRYRERQKAIMQRDLKSRKSKLVENRGKIRVSGRGREKQNRGGRRIKPEDKNDFKERDASGASGKGHGVNYTRTIELSRRRQPDRPTTRSRVVEVSRRAKTNAPFGLDKKERSRTKEKPRSKQSANKSIPKKSSHENSGDPSKIKSSKMSPKLEDLLEANLIEKSQEDRASIKLITKDPLKRISESMSKSYKSHESHSSSSKSPYPITLNPPKNKRESKRLKAKLSEDHEVYDLESKYIENLRDNFELIDHGDFFPKAKPNEKDVGEELDDDEEEEEEIYKVERIQTNDFVLCGKDSSIMYRRDPKVEPYRFHHSKIEMVNFKMYKDLWIWVSRKDRQLSILFVRPLDLDLKIPEYKTQTILVSSTILIEEGKLYYLTSIGVHRFDLQVVIEHLKNQKEEKPSPELVWTFKEPGDFCFNNKALYIVKNHANTISKVDYQSLTGPADHQRLRNIKTSSLIADDVVNVGYMKEVKIKPLNTFLVTCTADRIILSDSSPAPLDHYLSNHNVDFTCFTWDNRHFVIALHRRQDITVLSVFRGGFFVVNRLLSLEDDRQPYYGILHIQGFSFVAYGQNNYQKLFSINFSTK